jgi:small multidrug resistance pump
VGIALTALIGYFVFKQKLDLPAMIGIALMISGVIVVQVFSKTVSH